MGRRTLCLAVGVLVLLAVSTTGCTTALKQGYYTVTGASGSYYEVKVVDPAVLAEYQAVRVEPFGNDLGGVVPSDVIASVNRRIPVVLEGSELFYPEGKALRIQGRVIHYTGESGLPGAVFAVLTGGDACVCRVELHDDATGTLVGEGVCWGEVKSALRRGADEYGDGVAKGLEKWLKKRMPKGEQEKRKAELEPAE